MQLFKNLIFTITSVYAYTGDFTAYGASLDNQYCGFKKSSWVNQLTAAINAEQIANGTSCGLCASVEYNGKRTEILIDNLCPECKLGDLDLSHESWKAIVGDSDYRRVQGSWEFVDCSKFIDKNVQLSFYSINPWWLAVTPSQFKCGVSSMQIKVPDSDWVNMDIGSSMNGLYFIHHVPNSPVTGKFKFRLVSKLGDSIETDWFDKLETTLDTKKQFACDLEEDCFTRRVLRGSS